MEQVVVLDYKHLLDQDPAVVLPVSAADQVDQVVQEALVVRRDLVVQRDMVLQVLGDHQNQINYTDHLVMEVEADNTADLVLDQVLTADPVSDQVLKADLDQALKADLDQAKVVLMPVLLFFVTTTRLMLEMAVTSIVMKLVMELKLKKKVMPNQVLQKKKEVKL